LAEARDGSAQHTQSAIPAMLMRGGTSKGVFFLAADLPGERADRDRVLLAALGSPDVRQIDGVGGGDALTSKVAIVAPSAHPGADVDYLFAQVVVNEARVDTAQNCGNLLAAVGPFAIERGLVAVDGPLTRVRIRMVNTGTFVVAQVETPGGRVRYDGAARIDGVPGTAAPIRLEFLDIAGGSCGALLPTGNVLDTVAGVPATLIDNGMPVVVMRAADFGVSGHETPAAIEADGALRAAVERVRLAAGPLMNLGEVVKKNVPKMCLVAPPVRGGTVSTRSFIPHTVHKAIGVFGAVSVATACALPGSIGFEFARAADAGASTFEAGSSTSDVGSRTFEIEHPTGFLGVEMEVGNGARGLEVRRSALVRTARALMTGDLFVPSAAWRSESA
jgi:4-oxalomesaconate tautomerase